MDWSNAVKKPFCQQPNLMFFPESNILGALPLRVEISENPAAEWDQISSKAWFHIPARLWLHKLHI